MLSTSPSYDTKAAVAPNVLNELDSGAEIARLTSELLRRADAYGRLPTPVGDLLCAAHLTEPTQSFLSLSAIAQAPAHLRPILLRVGGKVHAALDRRTREVHINKVIDIGGHNAFKRLHETCHDLFYWQHVDDGRVGFADNEWSLSPRTKVRFEQEANQGAAELLFQRDYFGGVASDWVIGFGAIVELASMFGASLHATFRRYIECHRAPLAGVVLGCNPRTTEPLTYWRYETTCSASWLQRFDNPAAWPGFCRRSRTRLLSRPELVRLSGQSMDIGGIRIATKQFNICVLKRGRTRTASSC